MNRLSYWSGALSGFGSAVFGTGLINFSLLQLGVGGLCLPSGAWLVFRTRISKKVIG